MIIKSVYKGIAVLFHYVIVDKKGRAKHLGLKDVLGWDPEGLTCWSLEIEGGGLRERHVR